jgi:UDP-2,3-diacylglucosamine pyrophosphatase LpxH
MNKKRILIIADSHFTEHQPEAAVFHSLLETISGTGDDVLFIGDFFDLWIACPGYESGIHREFLEWCRKEILRRKIWFVEGNHEFFIRKNRSEYFTEVFTEEALLDGGKFYAIHGDMINYHDHAYSLLRAVLRNPLSYFVMRLFGYTGFGTSFSGKVRKDLRKTNQVQKHYYPRAELLELDKKLRARGVEHAVVGHFHRDGQEGMISLIRNFTETEDTIGIYESGKGIRRISAKTWIGEQK